MARIVVVGSTNVDLTFRVARLPRAGETVPGADVVAGLGGKGAPAELDALGGIMKMLGSLIGKQPQADTATRGFLGLDLKDDDKGVTVTTLLEKGPAASGGVKVGDRITRFQGKTVRDIDGMRQIAGKVASGDAVKLTVERDGKDREITFKSGEGL